MGLGILGAGEYLLSGNGLQKDVMGALWGDNGGT
jgi:hypothetical protein